MAQINDTLEELIGGSPVDIKFSIDELVVVGSETLVLNHPVHYSLVLNTRFFK